MPPPFLPREPTAIPTDALAKWEKIPSDTELSLKLTKFEVEDVYLLVKRIIEAQGHLQQSLIHYSNNNVGYANESMRASQDALQECQSELNMLMTMIMRRARIETGAP